MWEDESSSWFRHEFGAPMPTLPKEGGRRSGRYQKGAKTRDSFAGTGNRKGSVWPNKETEH